MNFRTLRVEHFINIYIYVLIKSAREIKGHFSRTGRHFNVLHITSRFFAPPQRLTRKFQRANYPANRSLWLSARASTHDTAQSLIKIDGGTGFQTTQSNFGATCVSRESIILADNTERAEVTNVVKSHLAVACRRKSSDVLRPDRFYYAR